MPQRPACAALAAAALALLVLAPGCTPAPQVNNPPLIASLTAQPNAVLTGQSAVLICEASDADNDPLTFQWQADKGVLSGEGSTVTWTAPAAAGVGTVTVTVTDGRDGSAFRSVGIIVSVNQAPAASFSVSPATASTGTVFTFDAGASTDAEDSAATLQARWDWEGDGTWEVDWTMEKRQTHAYDTAGTRWVKCEVRDSRGASSSASRRVAVTRPPAPWIEKIVDGDFTLGLGQAWTVFPTTVTLGTAEVSNHTLTLTQTGSGMIVHQIVDLRGQTWSEYEFVAWIDPHEVGTGSGIGLIVDSYSDLTFSSKEFLGQANVSAAGVKTFKIYPKPTHQVFDLWLMCHMAAGSSAKFANVSFRVR